MFSETRLFHPRDGIPFLLPPHTSKELNCDLDALPFVGRRDGPRDFWAVKPSGEYGADCETGRAWGEAFCRWLAYNPSPAVLGWIVRGMVEKQEKSGLRVGFMSAIAERVRWGETLRIHYERGQTNVLFLGETD